MDRHLTDPELVARCRTNQAALEQCFRTLYERHAPPTQRFLRSLVGEAGATDCLQETFLRIYRSLDRYDPGRSFRGWVFGVARNVAVDALRKAARRPETPLADTVPADDRGLPPEEVQRREEERIVRAAVDALPDHQRETFLLRQVEGLTYREVADVLGCSERTAKYRMRDAADRLARDLRRRGVLKGGSE